MKIVFVKFIDMWYKKDYFLFDDGSEKVIWMLGIDW